MSAKACDTEGKVLLRTGQSSYTSLRAGGVPGQGQSRGTAGDAPAFGNGRCRPQTGGGTGSVALRCERVPEHQVAVLGRAGQRCRGDTARLRRDGGMEGQRDGGMEGRGAGSAQTPPPLPLPALSIPRLSPISRPRVFSKCEPK